MVHTSEPWLTCGVLLPFSIPRRVGKAHVPLSPTVHSGGLSTCIDWTLTLKNLSARGVGGHSYHRLMVPCSTG